jgi:hypothetical protein
MDQETIPNSVKMLYARPRIRGLRITRMEETVLGRFRLTPETAWSLGTSNIGVFVGNSPPLGATIERLKRLEEHSPDAPTWVVVAAAKKMAAVIVHRWFLPEGARPVTVSTLELPKAHANIRLCTPETLRRVPAQEKTNIAGLILLDMLAHVHKFRNGFDVHGFHVSNDRPQLLANFRNSLDFGGWAPPLFILTQKPAKSIWTDTVARAYCLDALWFLEGRELYFGEDGDAHTSTTSPPVAIS